MNLKAKQFALTLAVTSALLLAIPVAQAANPCNPCAPKAVNPCAASNKLDAKLITRPHNYKPYTGASAELTTEGERLFKDSKLSTNGMSCNTCHQSNGAFQASFAKPYPHQVQMAKDRIGVKTIHLDEMIQACMVMPMAAKPLAWDSKELAALTAYTAELQKNFTPAKGKASNPCAPKNPCAAKNPCAPRK